MQKTLYMHSPHDQKEYDPETGEEILWAVHGNLYGTKLAAAVWYQDQQIKKLKQLILQHKLQQHLRK